MSQDSYRHGAQRRNNPTGEMAETAAPERKTPAPPSDRGEGDRAGAYPDPFLAPAARGKNRHRPGCSARSRRSIPPPGWRPCAATRAGRETCSAASTATRTRSRAKWDWYEHRGDWQNRLIHAPSKRAMASLLEHERMAGEVQCIYFDPPYGMDFDARYMDDALQVTAFRDSYEGGIHTYLDGIREVALLGRELLSETGSFFMQIGDVNVHRCAMVLDEVFGPENRVSTITYATGGGGSSTKSISKAGDFILWYAKDVSAPMHFQTLYEEQDIEAWCDAQTFATGLDQGNGSSRPLKPEERRDPKRNLPNDAVLWRMNPMLSQGASEGEQGEPFTHQRCAVRSGWTAKQAVERRPRRIAPPPRNWPAMVKRGGWTKKRRCKSTSS